MKNMQPVLKDNCHSLKVSLQLPTNSLGRQQMGVKREELTVALWS